MKHLQNQGIAIWTLFVCTDHMFARFLACVASVRKGRGRECRRELVRETTHAAKFPFPLPLSTPATQATRFQALACLYLSSPKDVRQNVTCNPIHDILVFIFTKYSYLHKWHKRSLVPWPNKISQYSQTGAGPWAPVAKRNISSSAGTKPAR